jgi:hypothetical protein
MDKRFTLLLFLLPALFFCSFTPAEEEQGKGTFTASVDGKPFQLREDQLCRGVLVSKPGTMDGRTPARTVISINFNGASVEKTPFDESMQFEILYEEEKTGEPGTYTIALKYQSADYSIIKEQSKLKITQFIWEADHKHFKLSSEFDCKMRSWGYPSDGKKDVSLKGRMSNVRITVPSWITPKN